MSGQTHGASLLLAQLGMLGLQFLSFAFSIAAGLAWKSSAARIHRRCLWFEGALGGFLLLISAVLVGMEAVDGLIRWRSLGDPLVLAGLIALGMWLGHFRLARRFAGAPP